MNRFPVWMRRFSVLILALAVVGGCDNNADVISTDDGGEGGSAFVIVPSGSELALQDTTVAFTVQGGDAPMSWSVSDSSLGGVTDTDGRTVNYTRSGTSQGVNEVKVEDAIGRTALAVVVQTDQGEAGSLRVSPSEAILHEVDEVVTLTAQGGVSPYSWSTIDSSLGTLSNTDQSSVNYRRIAAEPSVNVVELKDAQGTLVTATITQR